MVRDDSEEKGRTPFCVHASDVHVLACKNELIGIMSVNLLTYFRSLPLYIQWIKYISWLLHSSEALSILQWNGVHNICKFHFVNLYRG